MADLYLICCGLLLSIPGVLVLLEPARMEVILRRLFHSNWLFGLSLLLLCAGAALLTLPLAVGWLIVILGLALVVVPVRTLRVAADGLSAAGPLPHRLCGLAGVVAGGLLLIAGW